ncbi:uncharacterized protein LOC144580317 isoform X2 [Callithrix jacchus]
MNMIIGQGTDRRAPWHWTPPGLVREEWLGDCSEDTQTSSKTSYIQMKRLDQSFACLLPKDGSDHASKSQKGPMGTESFEGVYCLCKMTGWVKKSKVFYLQNKQSLGKGETCRSNPRAASGSVFPNKKPELLFTQTSDPWRQPGILGCPPAQRCPHCPRKMEAD